MLAMDDWQAGLERWLGSGLSYHSQEMAVAASAMAENKAGHLEKPVASGGVR